MELETHNAKDGTHKRGCLVFKITLDRMGFLSNPVFGATDYNLRISFPSFNSSHPKVED